MLADDVSRNLEISFIMLLVLSAFSPLRCFVLLVVHVNYGEKNHDHITDDGKWLLAGEMDPYAGILRHPSGETAMRGRRDPRHLFRV